MQKLSRPRKGSALLTVLAIMSVLLIMILSVSKAALSDARLSRIKLDQAKVFYLSESGIEHGKSKIAADPGWFTDDMSVGKDKTLLLSVCAGNKYILGDGGYKIVRAKGKNELYSIGFLGTDITKSRAFAFQRIEFELPIRQKRWEMF